MIEIRIDEGRLVEWASHAIGTPSFTGEERSMAELMRETFLDLGLQVQWQEVEDGRPNVLGTLTGAGGGRASCSTGTWTPRTRGRSRLRHVPGFQPTAFVEDGRLYGLGISNMKGALACYVEAVHALADAGVRLRGDLLVAAVCGEIEKSQFETQGAEYRGYAAGSRYLVSHGGVADMCILGEPTESKVVLGHFVLVGADLDQGPFVHTAFSEGRRGENSILRMRRARRGARVDPDLGGRSRERLPRGEGDRERRGDRGRVRLAGVAHTAPHGPLPRRPRAADEGDGGGARVLELVRELGERFPDHGVEGEVYVTAPGAEIAEDHPLVGALDAAHAAVFGAAPSAT